MNVINQDFCNYINIMTTSYVDQLHFTLVIPTAMLGGQTDVKF